MSRNTVADLSNWGPPQRVIKNARGRPIVEKLSPLLSRKVVDLEGNVVQQPAANGIANRSPMDPYGAQTHAEKLHGRPRMLKGTPGGILPYAKCPITIGFAWCLDEYDIPSREPCSVAHNGKPISNQDACKCIVSLIEKRQAANKARNDEDEERANKQIKMQERVLEKQESAAAANAEATASLAEAARLLAAQAGTRRGKKDDAE